MIWQVILFINLTVPYSILCSEKSLPLYRIDIYATIIELIRLQLRNANKDNTLFRTPEMNYLAKFCYYLYTIAPNAPLQIFEYDHWEDCAKPHAPPSFDQHFYPLD